MHINIPTNFERELVIKGTLKVLCIKSEYNDADIFTKNMSEEFYDKHSAKQVTEDPDI